MSDFLKIVELLKSKVKNLVKIQQNLINENKILKLELSKKEQEIQKLERISKVLLEESESLKIANSMLGSDENKRETKLKINFLIREIDSCINQLSN